jgi:2-polyprenyl-3-methyl-5-hydroxy-6-metoxy-1,4-benzoquinol methylase
MGFDWSSRKRAVKQVREMLPPIYRLPVAAGAKDTLVVGLSEGAMLLDVGASDRNLKEFLAKRFKGTFTYKSMDVDRNMHHDYYSLEEIKEKFDIIACFEVIEHLEAEEAVELFAALHGLLKDGGALYLSTPNVFHPTIFWRDSTHKTGFRYGELAGYLASAGFREIEIYRVGRKKLLNKLRAIAAQPVLRLLQMDHYTRILVRAYKKPEGRFYAG